jgi:hypothetical protein
MFVMLFWLRNTDVFGLSLTSCYLQYWTWQDDPKEHVVAPQKRQILRQIQNENVQGATGQTLTTILRMRTNLLQ